MDSLQLLPLLLESFLLILVHHLSICKLKCCGANGLVLLGGALTAFWLMDFKHRGWLFEAAWEQSINKHNDVLNMLAQALN